MLALGAGALGLLIRPTLRRRALPAWLARARARRRPGIPVTAWLLALLLMALAWWIGERRGILGFLLLATWLMAPLSAAWLTLLWIRRPRDRHAAIAAEDPGLQKPRISQGSGGPL